LYCSAQPLLLLLRPLINTAAGAAFKSFPNQQEARIWLGVAPPAAADTGRARQQASEQQQQQQQQQLQRNPAVGGSTIGRYYATARGRSTGVFPGPWNKVKGLVEGYSNPVYKGFPTHTEAQAYFEANSASGGTLTSSACHWLSAQCHYVGPPGAALETSSMIPGKGLPGTCCKPCCVIFCATVSRERVL